MQVYDQGSAVDCRKQVQRLNMMRKEKDDTMYAYIYTVVVQCTYAILNSPPYRATCSMQPPEGYSDVYATESGDDSPPMVRRL